MALLEDVRLAPMANEAARFLYADLAADGTVELRDWLQTTAGWSQTRFVADLPNYLGQGGPYLHDLRVVPEERGEGVRLLLGEGPEAYGFINQVRARAGMPAIDAATPGSFEDKLLHERRVELAFENNPWVDLRRFGREADVAANEAAVTRVKKLFPIPQREIDTAPEVMKQNPEYL